MSNQKGRFFTVPLSRQRIDAFLAKSPTDKQIAIRASAMENMAEQFDHYLVHWPALAESFRRDAELLRSHMKILHVAEHRAAPKRSYNVRLGKSHKPPIVEPSVFSKLAKIPSKPRTP